MNTILILAAGRSSRMKRCKLCIKVNGQSLIRRTVTEAIELKDHKVIVVTGAWKELIETELQGLNYTQVFNPNWAKGMGNSIACGIRYINENLASEYTIISVADQVFIKSEIFKKLIIENRKKRNSIIYSSYEKGSGPPSLFPNKYYEKLLSLDGDIGAKSIVQQSETQSIKFQKGNIDLDSPEDIQKLNA